MKLTELFNGSNPSLIMYDLDGTLVDSVADLMVSTNATLCDLGRPPASTENLSHWVGNGFLH